MAQGHAVDSRPNPFVNESSPSSSWPFPSSSWVSPPRRPQEGEGGKEKRGMPWMPPLPLPGPLPGPACENVCGALNHAV